MKKLISVSVFTFVFGISGLFAQSVNNIPLNEIDADYMQIVGTAKPFSTKVTIDIDFGQVDKVWSAKDKQIRDENGKLMAFNSMIDALNFFSHNGYEFVNAYAIVVNNQNVYHYMLRKKAS